MAHIKMVLYGEPGVGKSVFASKFPKPFFITTDGNYEWLEEFGAKPEAHIQTSSWEEVGKVIDTMNFDDYDTIVLDLLEDTFKWCEFEYCTRNKLEHISDVGFAKGYDSTRTEFFIKICKLLSLPKNIILLMHGTSWTTKDRRGVEHTKYGPSSRLPDKVTDMIEGRVRYFLRCYTKDEELSDGTLVKKRYLSLVPKPNEFGIVRGIDENKVPHDIPLEFDEFAKVIGYYKTKPKKAVKSEPKAELVKEDNKEVEGQVTIDDVIEEVESDPVETKKTTEPEVKTEVKTEEKVVSNEDKLAAIRAKLAALSNK